MVMHISAKDASEISLVGSSPATSAIIYPSIGKSGITANELGAVIMDNMAGEDFDGVEDGLSSQDLGDLAMSTARAILN